MKSIIRTVCFSLLAVLLVSSCAKDEVVLTGSIHGIVTDADNGMPVAYASVLLSPGGETSVTGSDGRYEFADLQPGRYTVQVSKKEYESNMKHISVEAGKTVSGDVTLSKASSKLKLSTSSLNFGSNWTTLSFSISNIGSSGSISWKVSTKGCNWLEVSPENGTTAKGKSSEVIVKVLRDQVSGPADAIICVEGDGESLPINVTVNQDINQGGDEERYVVVSPASIDLGTEDYDVFGIWSYNGITDYKLYVKNVDGWLSFSEVEGTVAKYDENNADNTITFITVYADREGLSAGTYNGSIIVRTDLGDYEIPVSMTVPQNNGGNDNPGGATFSGTVTSCRPGLAVELTGVSKSNGVLTVNFTVQNNENFDIYEFAPRNGWAGGGNFMAYDNQGGSYEASSVQELSLGSKTTSGYNFDLRIPIPQGVKLNGCLKIRGVPENVTEFTNISLPCLYYNQAGNITYDQKKIVFKNLKWN